MRIPKEFPLISVLRRLQSSLTSTKATSNYVEMFIRDKIKATGPITVADFMQIATTQVGYYGTTQHIFGEQGDFITAPEISQIFGELIAIWIIQMRSTITEHDSDWQLVELGGGSGELMEDILRTMRKLNVKNLASIHMIEISENLAERQGKLLCGDYSNNSLNGSTSHHGYPIFWHKTLSEFIEQSQNTFTVFVANEFFDALPIHQFKRGADGKWREVYVNLTKSDDRFCFMLSMGENIHTRVLIPEAVRNDFGRSEWECCPNGLKIITQISNILSRDDGFALIFDYGHDGTRASHSLRAYHKHSIVNPLENIGNVDLTADVDFGRMKEVLVENENLLVFGPVEQRRFLAEMGIAHRLEYLLGKCKMRQERQTLIESFKILMGDEENGGMGTRFKAFSLFNPQFKSQNSSESTPIGFLSTI